MWLRGRGLFREITELKRQFHVKAINDVKASIKAVIMLHHPHNLRKKNHVLEEILETIKEERMPLASYTRLHKEAVLTEGEKIAIENWVNEMIK